MKSLSVQQELNIISLCIVHVIKFQIDQMKQLTEFKITLNVERSFLIVSLIVDIILRWIVDDHKHVFLWEAQNFLKESYKIRSVYATKCQLKVYSLRRILIKHSITIVYTAFSLFLIRMFITCNSNTWIRYCIHSFKWCPWRRIILRYSAQKSFQTINLHVIKRKLLPKYKPVSFKNN
jgi:hypothetical protein